MAPFRAKTRVLGLLLGLLPWTAPAPASAANVVLLLMDDAAVSDADGMPTLKQLAREGTTFDRAYTPSPMCAPARAIIQSGQYSRNNGVTQNGYKQFVQTGAIGRTFAVDLRKAGVETRLVGKYINGAPPSVPGWSSFILQKETAGTSAKGYYDYVLKMDGKDVPHGKGPNDYSVDVERDLAAAGIKAAKGPFMTMLSVHSPHNPLTPPPRYLKAAGNERQRTLMAVDDALKGVVDVLKQTGRYEDTYVVVTSDHGLAFGRSPSKGVPYEGAIRVPLVVRGPGVPAGGVRHELVSLADLAPTFLDWMGAPAASEMDGRSLAPLLRGAGGGWRKALPITHERMSSAPNVPSWEGVRTERYTYVRFEGRGTEVYDMAQDPGQKRNIAGTNPTLTKQLAGLADALAGCAGARCRALEDKGAE